MFSITLSKGFHILFETGITLSTQFGGGNYCGNHDIEMGSEQLLSSLESEDVEIAIFEKDQGDWLTRQAYRETFDEDICDDVKGNVELPEWLKILDWCRSYKPKEKEK